MRKIILLAGARPNYMKIFPLWREFKKRKKFSQQIIHTGQHYDYNMSGAFFKDMNLPMPNIYLNSGIAFHDAQTAKIMVALESVLKKEKPDLVVVVGDVDSTLAGALVAAKMGITIAHVEAGLRSFDRSMPEEINRVVTDSISSLLFTSCRDADKNLLREGISKEKIYFVGNIMIDSLVAFLSKAKKTKILANLKLKPRDYMTVTLHRPVNVDSRESLKSILKKMEELANIHPIIFPVHPRTMKMLKSFNIKLKNPSLRLISPLSYLEFLYLISESSLVITDSGGIQEETTFLGIPCLTLRSNTERPITITQGTNRLIDINRQDLFKEAEKALKKQNSIVTKIEKWDGKTASRIADILETLC